MDVVERRKISIIKKKIHLIFKFWQYKEVTEDFIHFSVTGDGESFVHKNCNIYVKI